MTLRKGLLVTLATVSAARTAAALAESEATASQEPVLQEIVVTATRREESLQAVPVSITAISGDDLALQRVVAASDLASVVPNMSIQGSYVRQQPQFFLRGIGNTQN